MSISKMKKKTMIISMSIIFVLVAILAITLFINSRHEKTISKINELEAKRYLAYNEITDNDAKIDNCDYVRFSAFFTRDLDDDGYAEKYDGTCNEISKRATLYFDVNVLTDGRLENGIISIDGKNFTLSTALVEDNVILNDYISSNTTAIGLKTINNGTQKLFSGEISATNIEDNINNYSATDNTVTLTGTWISSDGKTSVDISKEIVIKTDWHGKTITKPSSSINMEHDINEVEGTDSSAFKFLLGYDETARELIIQKQVTEVEIPQFNGYDPISVSVISKNVTSTFENGILTITREATVGEDGGVTRSVPRSNIYEIEVKYPLSAYEMWTDDMITLELPTTGYYYGFNNSTEEFKTENPYISEASKIFQHTWVAPDEDNPTEQGVPKFYVYTGTSVSDSTASPSNRQVISKEMPINIYNGIENAEGKLDTYPVRWRVFTGDASTKDGIYMESNRIDTFTTSSGQNISMENYVRTTGIYFTNFDRVLKDGDAWIKVYDKDTGELLATFANYDWNKYSASNPYEFNKVVKSIRIETSKVKDNLNAYVNLIKEIDDKKLVTDFSYEEFEGLEFINSYLVGGFVESGADSLVNDSTDDAYYEAPVSTATFSMDPSEISNQVGRDVILKITTTASRYNEKKWTNGQFLIEMPKEILEVEIGYGDIQCDNPNVEIISSEIYEEFGKQYIKIYTANNIESTYCIEINAYITADPREIEVNKEVKLYAVNENCNNYRKGTTTADIYDINGDGYTEEQILYRTVGIKINAPSSLLTAQTVSDFDEQGTVVVSPQTAILDKSTSMRDANINVTVTNNYAGTISEAVIVGKIPFEGNTYQINGQEVGSTYSVQMKNTGIELSSEVARVAEVYYSRNTIVNKDLTDSSNNWQTAEEVTDWSQIKCYAIDLSRYVFQNNGKVEFSYGIVVPANINYNDVSYSTYGIYFCLDTENGKLQTMTEVNRLGIMIAKKFDIKLTKYKKGTDTKVQGATYRVTDGTSTRTGITNNEGIATMSELFVDKEYTLKEIVSPDSYVLNTDEIKFKVIVDETGIPQAVVTKGTLRDVATVANEAGLYTINLNVEDAAKYNLDIIKKDVQSGEVLKGVKFKLTGGEYGSLGRIYTTKESGEITMMNLAPDTNYKLEEITAKGYYIQDPITFIATRNELGDLEITSNNSEIQNATISEPDGVAKATISANVTNEKIPTYSLNINKNDKDNNKLAGTQFKLSSTDTGEELIATTDENGIATFDGLYQFLTGKYITGEYVLEEIVATEGYVTDTTPVRFKAELKSGVLNITILEGNDVVKSFSSNSTSITFNIENKPIFRLTKTDDNGTPLANAKFKITDLDGNPIKDVNGNIIGELLTNKNGEITANLPEGLYKVEEVEAPEGFELPEKIEDRVHYVGIGKSRPEESEFGNKFIKSIKGNGHSRIYDMKATSDGGYVVAGSFAGECDMNADGIVDITAKGSTDAYIAKFDKNGEYQWHYVLGTVGEDEFKRIDLTSDGGYVAVGYEYSSTYRDSVVVKVNSSGTQVWKTKPVTVPAGKNAYDDELTSVKVLPDGNIVITGNFYGEDVNVGTTLHTNANQKHQGFVAWLNANGGYIRSIALTSVGDANVNVTDVTVAQVDVNGETKDEIVVSADFIGRLSVSGQDIYSAYFEDENNKKIYYQDSVLIRYLLDGTYLGYTPISGTYTESIGKLVIDNEDNIIALGGFGSTLTLGSDTITPKTENVSNAIMLKFASNGDYISNYVIGSDNANNDNKFTSAVSTNDGGLLIGGWFYSSGIDIDGDGTNDITNKGQGDGIVIKLQEDGTVEWAKQIGGSLIDATHAVVKLNDGTCIAAGSFNSTSLTVDTTASALTMQGATDAYMVAWGTVVTAAEVPQTQTIEVINVSKKFEITTEIDANLDGQRVGGTITGTPTSDPYINFVEEVSYGYDSTIPIVITPSANYSVYKVTINDEEVQFTPDANGVVTLPVFENVTHNYHIKVVFEKDLYDVVVHHYLKDRAGNYTTTSLAEDEYYTGKLGSDYSTVPKPEIQINGITYNIAKVVNLPGYEVSGNYSLPTNRSGKFTATETVVTYYYEECPFELVVHHYLEGTENKLADDEVYSKYNGDTFETNYNTTLVDYDFMSELTTVNLDEGTYTKDENSKVTGTIYQNTEVTYYYKLEEFNITTKVNPITMTRHNELTDVYEEVTVNGGSISGEGQTPYESVPKGYDSQKEIKAVPDYGYRVKKITVNGVEQSFTASSDGSVTLDQFTNVREDKEVVVEFEPIRGTVIVHHYIKGTATPILLDDGTRAEDEKKTGYVGDIYATNRKENLAEGYVYDSFTGATTGEYIDGTIVVTYYYDVRINIELEKKWYHGTMNHELPDYVILQLMVDGKVTQEITMTRDNKVTIEGEPANQETWRYTIPDLPKYDSSGNEINYSVKEKIILPEVVIGFDKFEQKTTSYPWTVRSDGTWESGAKGVSNGTSTIQIPATNPIVLTETRTISFDYAASSQGVGSDYLYYRIGRVNDNNSITWLNTASEASISNSTTTNYASLPYVTVTKDLPAGKYVIEFTYTKNKNNNRGLDAGFVKNLKILGN